MFMQAKKAWVTYIMGVFGGDVCLPGIVVGNCLTGGDASPKMKDSAIQCLMQPRDGERISGG
jgi:hypothetical protein